MPPQPDTDDDQAPPAVRQAIQLPPATTAPFPEPAARQSTSAFTSGAVSPVATATGTAPAGQSDQSDQSGGAGQSGEAGTGDAGERPTAEAEAAAAQAPPPSGGSGGGDEVPPERPRKTVLAAAAIGGAVLITVPLLMMGFPKHKTTDRPAKAVGETVLEGASGPAPGVFESASASPTAAAKTTSPSPTPKASRAAQPTAGPSPAARTAVGNRTKSGSRSPGTAEPTPLGSWPLTGIADLRGSTVLDTAGTASGTAANVTWNSGDGGAAQFNGSSSEITTSGPVLDTAPGRSFTVSAWLYLNSMPAYATAVSQDGGADSGFYLQYSGADHRWCFARPGARALSTTIPRTGTWTHLVGVYVGSTGQLRLYVNGTLQGTNTEKAVHAATGSLVIGRARFGGKDVDWFPGAIKKVQVFNTALTSAQVAKVS